MKSYASHTFKFMLLLCIPFFIYGCGSSNSTPDANNASVSGTVLAGPAAGASVTVKTTAGTVVAGPVTTAADGSYTVVIPGASLASDLIFAASGGTFPDEATTTTGVALAALTAHAAAGSLVTGSHVTIDPSSTIVQKLVAGGRTKAAAETIFASAFGYTPDCSVKPAFATMSSASTINQRLAGLRAAAFSQLTKDLGLTPARQFELIEALAEDLSDETLDGMKGAIPVPTTIETPIPVDIANCYAKALMTFQTSPLNKSKLAIDRIGAPPFANKALTASYIVEYLPGMRAASQGKTSFIIKLSNRSDGFAATGKAVTLVPKMYMADRSHSAPVDTVIESAASPGTYNCSVFYQMPSGPGMGIWELKVSIGGESAIFYPPVAMSMGTTSRAILKGVTDFIGSGTVTRTYNLFNDSSTFGTSSTFKLFIAASDDIAMMNFPAVSVGSTLTQLTINTMTVEASTDNGNTWSSMTDNGGGHWSVVGLTGLASGGTIRVKVKINGEQKTTDGFALSASNRDYALFTIVGGM